MNEPIVTFSQSIVDDMLEKNIEFHHKAGLQPTITRTVVGHACDWCKNLAGTYNYFEKPDDIYRRHQRCRCVVEYNPKDGTKQNVWNKKVSKVNKSKILDENKDVAYISDLKNWQKKYNRKSIGVHDRYYWEVDGNRYVVDGKDVVLKYSYEEKRVAEFISKKLGVKVVMIPKVFNPQSIRTPDYLINGVPFDLKQPTGNGKNTIDGMFRKKEQAHNFIVDFSKTSLSEDEVLSQINRVYYSPNRKWIERIILMHNQIIVDIFKRK